MFGVNLMKSRMSKKGKKKAIMKKEKSLTDNTSVTSNVTATTVVAVQQNEQSANLKTAQTEKAHQIDDANKQTKIPQRHRMTIFATLINHP
ncbi:hypothetical protein T4E_9024 [Trichinella pseudospiralis]|uniref:Uncharacterized protein n=2 Tax=Trichinella pseudospiralis TaxID=6337 RepID=A0A0V0YC90_TRIPS|nr:hypothetical protein T4E_9024 [Trichinella pseudospiralis]